VLNDMVGRFARVVATVARRESSPRLAAIEWLEPPMAGGNWMPELIEIAGGISLFATAGQHSPWLNWDALIAADPEVILLLPCGFRIDQSLADLPLLAVQPGWAELTAVRRGRVFVIDGHHYFNRPGPRLVESAEMIAEILHPDRFDFGHQGVGWVRAPV
jgi:iron complex transport system substrate-binding protein